jgi:hypothetical protein
VRRCSFPLANLQPKHAIHVVAHLEHAIPVVARIELSSLAKLPGCCKRPREDRSGRRAPGRSAKKPPGRRGRCRRQTAARIPRASHARSTESRCARSPVAGSLQLHGSAPGLGAHDADDETPPPRESDQAAESDSTGPISRVVDDPGGIPAPPPFGTLDRAAAHGRLLNHVRGSRRGKNGRQTRRRRPWLSPNARISSSWRRQREQKRSCCQHPLGCVGATASSPKRWQLGRSAVGKCDRDTNARLPAQTGERRPSTWRRPRDPRA